MPSILENVIEKVGQELDDKARRALIDDADPVDALSILHRLAGRAEQVRNPSAFVATAVRTATSRGEAPGVQELNGALSRLQEDGTLDGEAVEVLRGGLMQDARTAVAGLLLQEAGTVRNASAYVTRNFFNLRKGGPPGQQGQPGQSPFVMPLASGAFHQKAPMMPPMVPTMMGMMPMQPMQTSMQVFMPARSRPMSNGGVPPMPPPAPGGFRGSDPAGNAMWTKWQRALDQKAVEALLALEPQGRNEILQELDTKAASIRNPSAYVQKACDNRKADGPGEAMESMPETSDRDKIEKFRGVLDGDAIEALESLMPEQLSAILDNLESRFSSLRNPSAYVSRSVANLIEGRERPDNTPRPPRPPPVPPAMPLMYVQPFGGMGGMGGGMAAASPPRARRSPPSSPRR